MADAVMSGHHESLGDLLEAVASDYPDHEAYVFGDTRFTFAQWYSRALELAGGLAKRGVTAGDVVVLTLPTSIGFAVSYVAVQLLGAVAAGVNTRLGGNEVAGILARSGAAAIIEGDADPRVPGAFGGLRVRVGDLAGSAPLKSRPPVAATDPAVIVWTSGTTGAPRGAWFDHAGHAAGARCSGLLSAPFDRRLMPTPFAHAGFMTRLRSPAPVLPGSRFASPIPLRSPHPAAAPPHLRRKFRPTGDMCLPSGSAQAPLLTKTRDISREPGAIMGI
jgi:acyl-CoA synthetase (AMP-forming)/AMP-acid ligase II